jgi:hypothetical protein
MTGRMKTILAVSAATLILAGCTQKTPGSGGNGTGKPPKAGAIQKIHLVWKGTFWKVKLNGGGEEDPKTAKTPLAPGDGPTMFVVDIQGPTTATFKESGSLDAWEGANAKSSPQVGVNSTQILGPSFTKDGKQMIFWDLNEGAPVTVNYRINFDTGPSVDPIVDNGGGNWN